MTTAAPPIYLKSTARYTCSLVHDAINRAGPVFTGSYCMTLKEPAHAITNN